MRMRRLGLVELRFGKTYEGVLSFSDRLGFVCCCNHGGFYGIAALGNPDEVFWDVVWRNLGWILLIGLGMAFVWSVSYLLRSGVSVSRQWTMIWQHSFPWRGRDRNLRNRP